jgi:DNA-binding transcriptional regulator YhcF (GntR family)
MQIVSITAVSKEIGFHRNIVSKYIFGLVKEGIVTQRRIGVVFICFLAKKREKR